MVKYFIFIFILGLNFFSFSQNSENKAIMASLIDYHDFKLLKIENLTFCDFILPKILHKIDSLNNYYEIVNHFEIKNKKSYNVLNYHSILKANSSIYFIIDDNPSKLDVRIGLLFYAFEECYFKFDDEFPDKYYYEFLNFK